MFTGIVTEQGRVKKIRRDGLLDVEISAPETSSDLRVGDSVSLNGVCLTATRVRRGRFRVQVMGETLSRTTLGELDEGQTINLEPAARLMDRMGGHVVQGHVDSVAEVVDVTEDEGSHQVRFQAAPDVLRYMVPKGSVTIDGVALTITSVDESGFATALIPHTLEVTTLGALTRGARVNVEVDVLAKYVERLMSRPIMGA